MASMLYNFHKNFSKIKLGSHNSIDFAIFHSKVVRIFLSVCWVVTASYAVTSYISKSIASLSFLNKINLFPIDCPSVNIEQNNISIHWNVVSFLLSKMSNASEWFKLFTPISFNVSLSSSSFLVLSQLFSACWSKIALPLGNVSKMHASKTLSIKKGIEYILLGLANHRS